MIKDEDEIRRIWLQNRIPVVYRDSTKGEYPKIKIPYDQGNRSWLKNGRKNNPHWIEGKKYWEIPRAWFNDFVNRALERYGSLYVIQPFKQQEKCARACMEAQGHECECSCMGANHGQGFHGSWIEISETFATRWHGRELACRLMKRKRFRDASDLY